MTKVEAYVERLSTGAAVLSDAADNALFGAAKVEEFIGTTSGLKYEVTELQQKIGKATMDAEMIQKGCTHITETKAKAAAEIVTTAMRGTSVPETRDSFLDAYNSARRVGQKAIQANIQAEYNTVVGLFQEILDRIDVIQAKVSHTGNSLLGLIPQFAAAEQRLDAYIYTRVLPGGNPSPPDLDAPPPEPRDTGNRYFM